MKARIVLIGGGSYNWTPTLAGDLFLRKPLDGSELVLVDIDQEAVDIMTRYCRMVAESTDWRVTSLPLEEALPGADIVCVSISTGGFETMAHDYGIPEKYGVYHTVSDTVGPGGISRVLRNVPVFVDIARKMEALCPRAWLIHVTNPLSQITRAVTKTTSVRCAGLCHEYQGAITHIASLIGAGVDDMDAVPVGVNHFTWLKDLTCCGKPVDGGLSLAEYLRYEADRKAPVKANTTDDDIRASLGEGTMEHYLNHALYERYGYFPAAAAPHIAENLPYFTNDPEVMKKYRIRRKGVLPVRQEQKNKKKSEILDILEGREKLEKRELSAEGFSVAVESILTGRVSRIIAAMPNTGQITNLPASAIVETWAMVSRGGLTPVTAGPIPQPLAGTVQLIVDEQELAVEAALTGDRELVYRALAVSPQLHQKDIVKELGDELIEANIDYLPQFNV